MKPHLPPVLYAASLALFGFAGWGAYQMLPLWKQEARLQAHAKGNDEATSMRTKGHQQGPQSAKWAYAPAEWWQGFEKVNLTGRLPPPPPGPPDDKDGGARPPVVVRPLEEIIELVSLVHDGPTNGTGGSSHVVVRFKPGVNVQPPEWWERENAALPPRSATPAANVVGKEGARNAANTGRAQGSHGAANAGAAASTPLRAQPILQQMWVQDDGDARRSATLWPIQADDGRAIGTIRLVHVAGDAQSAFFERQLPPKEGDPVLPPKEERLSKSAFGLPPDIVVAMLAMHGEPAAAARTAQPSATVANAWIETKATTRVHGVVNIGTDDEARFRDDADELLETLHVDTYAGRSGTVGLIVMGIESKLGASFGIAPGDVLVEINGRKVESKAQARVLVEGDYRRGVRTFRTTWLSSGKRVERTYQAPTR